MPVNEAAQLPRLNHFSPRYAAEIVGVSTKELTKLEKTTSLVRRGRGRYTGLYTRKSLEALIAYSKIAKARGVSIAAAWLSDNPGYGAEKFSPDGRRRKSSSCRIDREFYASARTIAEVANVDVTTARRYRSTGKAPYAVAELLDLRARGRIMPESWNHCFFNHRGRLEHYGVGEVNESEVLTINWARALHQRHVAVLENDLKQAKSRIKFLESALSEMRSDVGQLNAANGYDFNERSKS